MHVLLQPQPLLAQVIAKMQAVAAAKHGAKEQGRKKVGKADNIRKVGKEVGKKVGKNIKAPGNKTTLKLQKPVSKVQYSVSAKCKATQKTSGNLVCSSSRRRRSSTSVSLQLSPPPPSPS